MTSTVNVSAPGVASAALAMLGASGIASFDDGSTEANIAESLYEDVVVAMLCSHRWRFAVAQASMNHLAAPPTGRWDEAWQLPNDVLHVIAVTEDGVPIEYDIFGDMVYCDLDEEHTLIVDYIYRAPESEWLPMFRLGVEQYLAATFSVALRADEQLTKQLEAAADRTLRRARTIDSQQQTVRKIRTNKFLNSRLGSRTVIR